MFWSWVWLRMYTDLEKQLKIMIESVAPSTIYPRYCKIVKVNNHDSVDVLVNIGESLTLHNVLNIGNPCVNTKGVLVPVNGSWDSSVCLSDNLEESKFKYVNSLDDVVNPSSNYLYFLVNSTGVKLYVYYNGFKSLETGTGESADLTDYYTKSVIDSLLTSKADKSTTYTKSEVDKKISDAGGTDLTDYYNKTETNNLLTDKVNTTDYNTDKTNLESSISSKADETEVTSLTTRVSTVEINKINISDVYSKTDMDSLLSNKSNTSHTHTTSEISNLSTFMNSYYTKSYIDDLISNYYNKTEVDNLISGGGTDLSNYYNKTETDNLLTGKSNTSHTHTTSSITDLSSVLGAYATDSELSSGLSGKANSSDVYTQSQVNSMVNSKADQSSLNSTNSNVSSLSSRMSTAESNINNKVSKGWSLIQSLTVGNLYNNGSMTMLKMNGSLSVNSSGWTTLGTISTTYAPPYSQTAIDGAGCFILVTSAGAVQTYYKGIFGDTKSKTSGNPPQVIWVCNGDM